MTGRVERGGNAATGDEYTISKRSLRWRLGGGTKRPRSSGELWLRAVSYPLSLPTSPSAPRFGFAFAHPAAASYRGAGCTGADRGGAVTFLEEIKKTNQPTKQKNPAKVTLRLRMLRGWESGTRGWAAGAGADRPREVAVLSRPPPR